MLNNFVLQGRLTKDVEYGQTNSGINYANFTIAWNEKYNETETNLFMNCKSWRGTADLINKYFKKGDELIVEGKIITEIYEKDGNKKSSTRMIVDKIHFTYGKKNNSEDNVKTELTPVEDDSSLPF